MGNKTIGIILVALVVGFAVFFGGRDIDVPAPRQLETKTDEQNSVTVTITPANISPQAGEWQFNVLIDTHSVELDQDMVKISVLIDDQGKEYKPLRWEGAEPGGHHREGMLVFKQITPNPKSLGVKISGIGNVDRSFVWRI